jgi:hypothetical protein
MGLTTVWNCLQERTSEDHKIPLPAHYGSSMHFFSYLYLYFKFAQVTSFFSLPCLPKQNRIYYAMEIKKLQHFISRIARVEVIIIDKRKLETILVYPTQLCI